MLLNHTSEFTALTEAQYAAVGKAVVEWANIEYLLGVVLTRLLATPEFLGRTYTDSMSAARLQDAIIEAVEIHRVRYGLRLVGEPLLNEIAKVNGEITSLRVTRNKIAHFCWCRSTDEELFGTNFAGGVTSPKKERRDSAVLSSTALAELHTKTFAIVEQLMSIVTRLPRITEESLLTPPSSGQPSTVDHSKL